MRGGNCESSFRSSCIGSAVKYLKDTRPSYGWNCFLAASRSLVSISDRR